MQAKIILKRKLKKDSKEYLITIIIQFPINPVPSKIIKMKTLLMDRIIKKKIKMINQVFNI